MKRELKRGMRFTGRKYMVIQCTLIAWFVAHGHTELEYVTRLAKLFEEHHRG